MAKITNKGAALIHVGGVQLVPGVEIELPDEMLSRKGVKALLKAETLELAEAAAAAKAETARKVRETP